MNQLTGSRTVAFTTHETAEQNPSPTLYLCLHLRNVPPALQALSREVFDVAMDALAQTLHFFRHERDPLSLKLIDWLINFFVNDAYSDNFDGEYLLDVEARIRTLWQEILVNPLTGQPLEDPILVNKKVWDGSMWIEFLSLAPQPSCEVREHKFGAAVIKCMSLFPKVETTPTPTLQLAGTVFSPMQGVLSSQTAPVLSREMLAQCPPDLKKLIYSRLMINTECTNGINQLQQKMIENADKCCKLLEETRNSKEAHIAAAEKEAKEHLERVDHSIANIEKAYDDTAQIINGMIDETRRQNRENAARLEASEQRSAMQEGELRYMRRQLSDLDATCLAIQKKVKKNNKRSWGLKW